METQRLILRDRTRALIAETRQLPMKDQLVFFGYEKEEQVKYMLERMDIGLSNPLVDYRIFELIDKNTKRVIGNCGFHSWLKEHSRTEISYELHEPFRKQGFMNEALKKIIPFGFEVLKINRIEAIISPSNIDSIKTVERIGFKKEGLLRKHHKTGDGTFNDSFLYALLASDL